MAETKSENVAVEPVAGTGGAVLLAAVQRGYFFRRGQWVKFKPPTSINGAHTLADGFVVGIYHSAGRESEITVKNADGTEEKLQPWTEARVYVCAPNGNNLPYINPDTQDVCFKMWFPPEACPQLQPVLDRADIPAERCKNMPEGWQPVP